ncbi:MULTISPECIES: SUMF1/EgtB/PvdO family nonheme iron enzyme [Photorhabdus]|uniref:Photorhabdus luminescens subsp. laumondii TTO1 complete genome segment 9/17 n=1 Tax=Photorhabdus laumondii subsp. laumondii (strain DSM 15139 / CIP 105565 / TT01) TaxID=243265 RepID=Q7N477_PHOLL|nr:MULTISPECIES: SUMF1/EgtB/PvdO family nonheme iron enzyme [Photorhabdus]AWK42226.1 serine/threonine protein kinase [Photorhabdus laumondii subsp. laumondii]AXG47546.1 serine/threonine protein kinase [Photorhabdus laumondii subsp. laumondii]KTL59817.1 serine/threonine protein kinase [Photorhabdus laumondii subsp. laumondii]RAW68700.1 serine/threonine protein kinase [Photorhabdus sp. S7-51]RAW69719.1 serine/threonine protein kinase [Photorhabdus sp. S14-60]
MIEKELSLTGIKTQHINIENKDINSLTIKEAMGLPDKTNQTLMGELFKIYDEHSKLDSCTLQSIIRDFNECFSHRYVAGNLLAIRGDSRISIFEPDVIIIPGGKVRLGLSPDNVDEIVSMYSQYGVLKEWILKEIPSYEITLSSFGLARYCVTNYEYYLFLGDTGYQEIPDSWAWGMYPHQRSNYPVYSVSYEAAMSYALWLSEKTGRNFHIPSEAQWEYAATGGNGREFPWGNEFLPDHCNSIESGIVDATPVGIFPLGMGPFGHLDLAGNVEEYTSDSYLPYQSGTAVYDDLMLTEGSHYKVARGGSFTRFRDLCRTRRRHGRYHSPLYIMGFRLAENLV